LKIILVDTTKVKKNSVNSFVDPTGFLYFKLIMEEAEEISRHKWIESEKVGHDIGTHKAHMSWMKHHRGDWIKAKIIKIKNR
jgi:hypothetical protein